MFLFVVVGDREKPILDQKVRMEITDFIQYSDMKQ